LREEKKTNKRWTTVRAEKPCHIQIKKRGKKPIPFLEGEGGKKKGNILGVMNKRTRIPAPEKGNEGKGKRRGPKKEEKV